MRTICRFVFCGLAVVSFAVFITQHLSNINLSEDALQFMEYTALVTAGLFALFWLAKRTWMARDLIGRIILVLVLVITAILIVTVPELQQAVLSGLEVLARQPLVITVLCLILCGFCCSRPAPQSKI
jgi:hypothetical protein